MAEPLLDFVARRRPDWDELERLVGKLQRGGLRLEDVSALDRLYRRAAADLAHAAAQYPNTDLLRYLHQLCGAAYGAIYRAPRDRLAALRRFYAAELPRAFRAEGRFVALSAGLLVLGVAVGALIATLSPEATQIVVPRALRDSIAAHRMWTDDIVGIAPNFLSSAIATNNLTVTVMAFASGITLGLGTTYLLVTNGMMLGAVIALCLREGMGYPFFSFIGGHGPVEMSVIVISGAAGLMLGHSLIDPGDARRAEHVRRRATDAVRLVLGCAPFLALIALIEGFVSPGAVFPGWLKIALGLALGAALWGYLLTAARDGGPTGARAPRAVR